MIGIQKPSLPICVLGVGAVHVALLMGVLQVMITLPAPEDGARRTMAVPVAVRTALPAPVASTAAAGPGLFSEVILYGEGDADEIVLPAAIPVPLVHEPLPVRNAVTQVPPLIRQAALSGPKASAPPDAIVNPVATPLAASPERASESVVARFPDFMPDVVPYPKRKPDFASLKTAPAVVKRPRPAAKKKVRRTPPATSRRVTKTQPQPKPLLGGIFSTPPKQRGSQGRARTEYPRPGAR